jgi:acyl-CoA thioester hydrolase
MPRVFKHRIRVRYGECDPQGVVFNANYLAYFDVVLTEWWREALGSYNAMLEAGTDMVVAEVRARYLAPAGFDDVVAIGVTPTRLGNTAMTTRIEVRLGETLLVEGEMRHVFVDLATRGKCPIPEDVRRGLEPYLSESAAPAAAAADATRPRGGAGPDAGERTRPGRAPAR